MWRLTRRTAVTRVAMIPEFDRPIVTALIAAKSPRLALGRAAVQSHHGLGAVAIVVVGISNDDLAWLEGATVALDTQVTYLPIRRSDSRTAEREIEFALADSLTGVAYARKQAEEAEAILAGERATNQPATDRELRRIVGEGQMIRRRGIDRDLLLADKYVTHGSIDQTAITERAADRQRYEEVRDEYQLMNGGEPAVWPF